MLLADAPPGAPFWQDYLSVQFDPAHLLSELGFSLVFEALQFVLLVILWRKVVKPRWFAKAHENFDQSHGLSHQERHDGNLPDLRGGDRLLDAGDADRCHRVEIRRHG